MDPALRELLAGDETEELEVILKLRHPQAVPPHVRLVARFGQVVTGRVERRWIREVWGHPEVESFKAPRLLQAETEIFDLEAAGDVEGRSTDIRRPSGLNVSGRGTVIGLVDVGCDFAHPHFRQADGSTRLLALWDQSKSGPDSPPPYGYGTIYSREAINRALAHPQPYATIGYHPAKADPLEVGAHGTLVMDIAAGNGNIPGSPKGIAPEADLIFVHAATGIREGLANLGDSVRILEAIDFIARTARGRPWVINVSMGRRGGSHDGLSLVEQGMDALLLETPGAALVLSTGNYFTSRAHASGQLRPAQQRTLVWRTDKADITPNELEIWYSGKDVMILEVKVPGKGGIIRTAPAEDCPVVIEGQNVGHIYHRARDPNNGDNQINIFLRPEAPAGEWQLTLFGQDIVDGLFHAWVERDAPCPHCDSRFETQDADPFCTTGTLCNGFRTLAAGAYDGHSANREIAAFSSCGPLRDFRQKPDLIAPGVQILGARSASWSEARPEPGLTRMSGTSFAAPQVTGTIALMFEAAGRPLAIQETHRLLLGNTRSFAADKDAVRFGSGYLDIEAAVAAAAQLKGEGWVNAFGWTPIETNIVEKDFLSAKELEMESNMAGMDEAGRVKNRYAWPSTKDETAFKNLGLQNIYSETGIESEEAFWETVKIEEPEAEESEEKRWIDVQAEEPEESVWDQPAVFDLGERLVKVADGMITSQGSPAKPADFFSKVLKSAKIHAFKDPLGKVRFPSPEIIFKSWKKPDSEQWKYMQRYLAVIAGPEEILSRPLQTGDILVRVSLGEPGLDHLALVADPGVRRLEDVIGAGLVPEGRRPGKYVQVVEDGVKSHNRWEGYARRVTDADGRILRNQMILRLIVEAPELSEQVTTSPITTGEFGKALNKYWGPNDVIDLLKLSSTFVKMVKNLDGLYVDVWNSARTAHRSDISQNFSDGILTIGSTKRRVININTSNTGSSWFQPYSIASSGNYDAIYIENIDMADLGKWIEIIAHETSHAFRFANGQLLSPKITCPLDKKIMADLIQDRIKDEILARMIEAQVLKEIQAKPGGKAIRTYHPTTGSTDQNIVERDVFVMGWEGTYLEHFVLGTLTQEAIVCDNLDEKTLKDKNYNVGRIPLEKRKLQDYLIDQNYIDPDSGKLTKFATKYARLRFIQRVIEARWKDFKDHHSTTDKNFDQIREKTLQEHCKAFFQGIVSYTPLKP